MWCANILTGHVLSAWPKIARCNEFCAPIQQISVIKKSWSAYQLEQALLVYYQLRQTPPFSVMLLQSQLPHGGLFADFLPGLAAVQYIVVSTTLIVVQF